jgi:hypothetical protein
MTLPDEAKITDAYLTLRLYSKTLSVEELCELAGFEPQETGVKGTVHKRGQPTPANYIILNTEELVAEKDLDMHIQEMGRRLPPGRFVDRFKAGGFDIHLTVYWWTTEPVNYYLSSESFRILENVGVPAYFNFLIDDGTVGV